MISSKLPNTGTTIFTVMSQMAREHNAIDLSQGYPDFRCSQKLIDLVKKYMDKGYNQYAPMQGVEELRKKIVQKVGKLYGTHYHPDREINITAGATQALFTAITACVKEGDEVIIFEPAYDAYVPAIQISGGQPVFIKLKPPDFTIDWDEVARAMNSRTRMIIINTPKNPSGSVLPSEDLKKLEKMTNGTKILILSDEVYEHIVFGGLRHESVCRYPDLADHSIVISSFGKTYHTTGWKVGYCLAPEALMKEFRKVHQFSTFAVNTPAQHAFAEFMEREDEYLGLSEFYQKKRDYFNSLLLDSKFIFNPSQGTYFQTVDYSEISDEKDTDFAARITKEFGVASIPLSVFFHEPVKSKVIRFCFAKADETLEKAAEKLVRIR